MRYPLLNLMYLVGEATEDFLFCCPLIVDMMTSRASLSISKWWNPASKQKSTQTAHYVAMAPFFKEENTCIWSNPCKLFLEFAPPVCNKTAHYMAMAAFSSPQLTFWMGTWPSWLSSTLTGDAKTMLKWGCGTLFLSPRSTPRFYKVIMCPLIYKFSHVLMKVLFRIQKIKINNIT